MAGRLPPAHRAAATPAARTRRPDPSGPGDPVPDDALWDMERSLRRRGFSAVAGADVAVLLGLDCLLFGGSCDLWEGVLRPVTGQAVSMPP